ncbi:UNVERIFIED_CONTAM: hypothetical protein K2H54_054388 [Gekko kuhli]
MHPAPEGRLDDSAEVPQHTGPHADGEAGWTAVWLAASGDEGCVVAATAGGRAPAWQRFCRRCRRFSTCGGCPYATSDGDEGDEEDAADTSRRRRQHRHQRSLHLDCRRELGNVGAERDWVLEITERLLGSEESRSQAGEPPAWVSLSSVAILLGDVERQLGWRVGSQDAPMLMALDSVEAREAGKRREPRERLGSEQ